ERARPDEGGGPGLLRPAPLAPRSAPAPKGLGPRSRAGAGGPAADAGFPARAALKSRQRGRANAIFGGDRPPLCRDVRRPLNLWAERPQTSHAGHAEAGVLAAHVRM